MGSNQFVATTAIMAAFLLISCATQPLPPEPVDIPIKTEPEVEVKEREPGPLPASTRPTYNLSGYPAATRQGYIDGCETAKKTKYAFKDPKRYASDGQYQMGWNDGFDICNVK